MRTAEQDQLRRGTTAEHLLFVGAEAETTYDKDLRTLRVHDGQTNGGAVVMTKNPNGTISLGAYRISADGSTITCLHGQANWRAVNGQSQYYDPVAHGWRAFGCVDGAPAFGDVVA